MGKNDIKNVVSIAGVDPSGGAGLLADIKSLSAAGVYGAGVVTALTAQNTRAVTGVFPIPGTFIREQIDTLFSDVRIDAVKIGMLADSQVIRAVAERLRFWKPQWIVLDPVMVAKSGDALLAPEAVRALIEELLPIASVLTPNLPEAGVLLSRTVTQIDQMEQAARDLFELSGRHCAVLLKGGHLSGTVCRDVLFDGKDVTERISPRLNTKNTHGTGCAMSSFLAACLARTGNLKEAFALTQDWMARAIASSDELDCGKGHGPIHHFVNLWKH